MKVSDVMCLLCWQGRTDHWMFAYEVKTINVVDEYTIELVFVDGTTERLHTWDIAY